MIFGDYKKTLYQGGDVACDTETTGLDCFSFKNKCSPFAFSFTSYNNDNLYIDFPVDPYTRDVLYNENIDGLEILIDFFSSKNTTKIFHNAFFDLNMIEKNICTVQGTVHDTMILYHTINNNCFSYGLKSLTRWLFNMDNDDEIFLKQEVIKQRRIGKSKGYLLADNVEADYWLAGKECMEYAIKDTDRTMALWYAYKDNINKNYNTEMELLPILRNMTITGIRVDYNKALELKEYYTNILNTKIKEKEQLGYGTLNPKSSKQMKKVFYTDKKKEVKYKKIKKNGEFEFRPTTNSKTLFRWANQGDSLAKTLIDYEAAGYQLSNFIIPILNNSVLGSNGYRLHPSYKQVGAKTARISCSNPNLMNISSNDSANKVTEYNYRVRECFIPDPGTKLYFYDYSQIEVWGAAFLSNDKVLCAALLNGDDIHKITATACFGNMADFEENFKLYRKRAKFINFGSIYGATGQTLAENMGTDFKTGDEAYKKFWSTYKDLYLYSQELSNQIKYNSFITSPFGRRYYINKNESYKSLNAMVQGTCADIIKQAKINVNDFIRSNNYNIKLLLTIHDELCIQVDNKLEEGYVIDNITKCMQGNFHEIIGSPVPLKIGVSVTSTNWMEKKDIL